MSVSNLGLESNGLSTLAWLKNFLCLYIRGIYANVVNLRIWLIFLSRVFALMSLF